MQPSYRHPKPQGFQATALQVRRAWEAFYGVRMPEDGLSYQDRANELVAALGFEAARAVIRSQSNDPNTP